MAVWTVISAAELGASAASFTISSISSSYDHLYFTISCRDGKTAYYNNLEYRFNGDSHPYSATYLAAEANPPTSYRHTSSDGIGDVLSVCTSASVLADTFGTSTLWIPNYANTANFKQCIATGFVPNNTTTDNQWYIKMTAGLFAETGAIHTIRIKSDGAPQFVQYTSYVLYGITGA